MNVQANVQDSLLLLLAVQCPPQAQVEDLLLLLL
jgi:hypothetical protein